DPELVRRRRGGGRGDRGGLAPGRRGRVEADLEPHREEQDRRRVVELRELPRRVGKFDELAEQPRHVLIEAREVAAPPVDLLADRRDTLLELGELAAIPLRRESLALGELGLRVP